MVTEEDIDKILFQLTRYAPFEIRWQFCELADHIHDRKPGVYAHSLHYTNVICFAQSSIPDLSKSNIKALIAHECGHIKLGERGTEAEADAFGARLLGVRTMNYDRHGVQTVRRTGIGRTRALKLRKRR